MKPCHHTTNTLCGSFYQREEQTRSVACFPPGFWPFFGKWQPMLWGQQTAILAQWKAGVTHVLHPDPHLVPNMLDGFHAWTLSWPVRDLHIQKCPTMNKGPQLLSIGWMNTSFSFPHDCSAHEHDHHCKTAWNEILLKTQCLKSHFLSVLPHTGRHRLWSKESIWDTLGTLRLIVRRQKPV